MKINTRIKIRFIIVIILIINCMFALNSCASLSAISDWNGWNGENSEDLTFVSRSLAEQEQAKIKESELELNNNDINANENDDNYNNNGAGNNMTIPQTTQQITEPPLPAPIRLRFVAAGDSIIHSNMIDDAAQRINEETNIDNSKYNFKAFYAPIKDYIKSFDIAFVNAETPIAGDEFAYSGYPNFNTPKENGEALVDAGFNIVNIANNHMLDCREKGYINNINFWESQPVLLIGGFKDEEDFENIRIYNKDGVSIAFLSYTYGTNGMVLPKDSKMIVPLDDFDTVERQIKKARKMADLLFVVMHWGYEDNFEPSDIQRNYAQMMVDNNVDVIIGMHPHVLQPIKWVENEDGHKTLIAYSLGNFISGMLPARNMLGAFLQFDIVKEFNKDGSKVFIENAELVPLVTHYNMSRKGFYVYKFEDYTVELAKLHGCIRNDSKFSYDYLRGLVVDNIASEFLGDFWK